MGLDIEDLKPVAIPRTITPANREIIAELGTRAVVRRTVYLVRPEADLIWIETERGEVAVRPGDVVEYDPLTKLAKRLSAEEAEAYELVPLSASAQVDAPLAPSAAAPTPASTETDAAAGEQQQPPEPPPAGSGAAEGAVS